MALFPTDDLLQSDKKRKNAPEGTASVLTSISERDNLAISLKQPLKDLEIVTNYHDIPLRSLEAWSTTAFLVDPDTEPAPPRGPPRRILAKTLGQWLHSQLPSDGPFAKYHATLINPEDLEQRSVNLLVARKTQKGDKFIRRTRTHTLQLCQHGTRHSRCSPTGSDNNRTAKSFTMQLLPAQKPDTLPVEPAAIPTSKNGVADRETPRNSELSTFSLFLFFFLSETVGALRQRCA